MRTLESFNVLESFGFGTNENGMFQEVSELEMSDVVGGACGGGTGCFFCPTYNPCGSSYIFCSPVGL